MILLKSKTYIDFKKPSKFLGKKIFKYTNEPKN